MRHVIYIGIFVYLSALLGGCISVEIPIGDAIKNTKDWINEERDRKQQQDQPPAEQTTQQATPS